MDEQIEYNEINAKKAMEENNIPLAIEIYKKLCEKDEFNNQILLARYGLALRKGDKPKEFIEICREYIKTKKINAEFLNNVLCWCIYDEYIKKYNEENTENFDKFLKEAQYICNNTTQLPAKEHFKNPYVLTVEKVIKIYNNRNNTNYNDVLKWIELLKPDMLSSDDAYIFIDKDGKDREKASHKEFYYQNKIKALEKTYQYELCYKLCEECFEKIENLHYKNETWIESRKLYCKCMIDSQYIDEYIKFAEEKKLWHIYAKVSEICFRYNKLEEATIYGCKSILCSFEFQRMVKLYLTMGQLFENIGQSANAKIMYHAAAYYRNANLWNIPQELEYVIEKYNIDMTKKINRKDIEKIARNYLVNKKIIRIGQITKIIQEKKCGFIKINDENNTIYFKIKDIKNGFAEKNKYAEFEIIEYEDKKRAINIKVIRGGNQMEVYVNPNDIDMILELYKSQDESFVIKSFPKRADRRRCDFYIDGQECLIDFFIKKDGKVRIQPVGKNIEYTNKILEFFKTKTMNANVETKTCTINCEEIVVSNLVEYIKEDCSQLVNVVQTTNIIKFEGYNGDTVTCTFYKTKSKLMIQAKPLYTFSLIVSYLSQFDTIKLDDIIEITNSMSGQSISREVIRNDMKKILVNSYSYLDEALKKSISGSLILLKRKDYSEDYTGYVTGEFKALEGYLKKILTQQYKYTFDRNKPNFSMFAKNNPQNKSAIDMDSRLSDDEKNALNSLYKIYKNKRNVYLHGKIDPSQTRVIENLSEAQSLSDEILDSIERSYNIIFK